MKNSTDSLLPVTLKLLNYCRENDWAGYDPYDALNSKIFKSLPFLDFRYFRLALTQILKRSPINIRTILLVPKTLNPKAVALFLMALLKLSKLGLLEDQSLIRFMVEKLVELRSQNTDYWCWGYSFPWQGRTLLVPRAKPNLVCTVFVANALLNAYKQNRESRYLSMAVSAAEYIMNELYWTDGASTASLSYPLPGLQTRVHNANFLGAAVLCRVYKQSGEKKFIEPALKLARYSTSRQRKDGSWSYGEHGTQRWIDNFHTGYNLCALKSISECAETSEFDDHIRGGFEFYRNNFFTEEGTPKYFHNRTYPIDIHSVAQSIITLMVFKDLHANNTGLAHTVFKWAMDHMWDKRGYFFYQVHPLYKNRIPYMRWSQAWMILALAILIEHSDK